MVTLDEGAKYVVFTAMKKLQKPFWETEIDNDDSPNVIEDCHYPTIFFHKLKSNKIEWEINGGEFFIDAIPNKNQKDFNVYYFTNELWVY